MADGFQEGALQEDRSREQALKNFCRISLAGTLLGNANHMTKPKGIMGGVSQAANAGRCASLGVAKAEPPIAGKQVLANLIPV